MDGCLRLLQVSVTVCAWEVKDQAGDESEAVSLLSCLWEYSSAYFQVENLVSVLHLL